MRAHASHGRRVAGIDHLERVTRILGGSWWFLAAVESAQRLLENVASGDDPWISRIPREQFARVPILFPREAGNSVVEAKVRCSAAIEPCSDTRSSTE